MSTLLRVALSLVACGGIGLTLRTVLRDRLLAPRIDERDVRQRDR